MITRKSGRGQDMPWFAFEATEWLSTKLRRNMATFEYGSGGSTLFFGKRVGRHIAIEHNREWYETVKKRLERENLTNVNLIHAPLQTVDEQSYAATIDRFPGPFDMILIDGHDRNGCIFMAKARVAKGGYIILDDSDRPEYAEALEALASFERKDFRGLGPINAYISETSVFKEPTKI